MKLFPSLQFGGVSPVNAYLIHSIIVVLPQPFAPKINVNGVEKVIRYAAVANQEEHISLG